MTLSCASIQVLRDGLVSKVAGHHRLISYLPSFPDLQCLYTDGSTALGENAARILGDLGGMEAAW